MKLIGAVLTVIVFGFIGFIVTIFTALTGNAEFYTTFIPIITIGLVIIIICSIYGQLKKKIPKISAIVFVILGIISILFYEGYQAYIISLEIVSTQDVDLSEYQPFAEHTKAVSLNERSTYKIEENLPLLDGATALYPVYAAFAQAVYPEKEYPVFESEVVSSQTSHAFERLVKGDIDIAFMAHPSDKQMKDAQKRGIELKLNPIGREAFVFFVHKNNQVGELSIKQIQGIYSGKLTNWADVGGYNEEIRAFQRPEGSGSQSALLHVMDDIPIMIPPSKDIVSGMGGIIKRTTNYRNQTNAIGYSFRHFSQTMVENGKIKYIAVNGVLPTKENIQNETYPIVAESYAITTNRENPHVEPFINWMQSEQGQEIIERTGYVPLD